jgi:hypothetical protein
MSSRVGHLTSAIAILSIASAALACRNETSPPSAERTGGVAPVTPAAGDGLIGLDVVARCAGFTPIDAASLLGTEAHAVSDRSTDIHASARSCAFARTDSGASVVFTLEHDESVEDAARAYAQMKEAIPIAREAQESAGDDDESALIEISGLGDEALWTNVNGALTVRERNLTILVTNPSDRPAQIKVAQRVVTLLGAER